MAFSTDDFSKVWASTSPLTPYEFSDSNYKKGWNFVGSTPPARQMWDFLQKQNDEKTQWLYNNKLSLSGGTMSGAIVWSGTNLNAIERNNGNDGLCIIGGDTDNFSGATLQLFGQNHPNYAGRFYLRASNKTGLSDTDSSHTSVDLVGYPNGSLTWGNVSLTDGTFLTVRSVNLTVPNNPSNNIGNATAPAVSGYQFIAWIAFISNGAVFPCYGNGVNLTSTRVWIPTSHLSEASGKSIDCWALYVRKW